MWLARFARPVRSHMCAANMCSKPFADGCCVDSYSYRPAVASRCSAERPCPSPTPARPPKLAMNHRGVLAMDRAKAASRDGSAAGVPVGIGAPVGSGAQGGVTPAAPGFHWASGAYLVDAVMPAALDHHSVAAAPAGCCVPGGPGDHSAASAPAACCVPVGSGAPGGVTPAAPGNRWALGLHWAGRHGGVLVGSGVPGGPGDHSAASAAAACCVSGGTRDHSAASAPAGCSVPVGSGAPGGVTPAAPGNHAADGGPPGSLKRIWSELEADHGASLTMLQGQMELIRELEKKETELGQLEETELPF